MSGEAGMGHLVHYLSPHGGMFHAIASGFGSLDAKGDWSKVTCPACLAHRPAPDAAGIEAALASGLGEDHLIFNATNGAVTCTCNPLPWMTFEEYAAHLAAALLPVVTQAQAAERAAVSALIETGRHNGDSARAALARARERLVEYDARARADESGA